MPFEKTHRGRAMKKLCATCLLIVASGCGVSNTIEIRARTDLAQLQNAVEGFQEDYHVSYLPSRIKLSEAGNYPQRNQPHMLDFDSVHYLHKLWPKLDLAAGCRIDWNGDGQCKGDWVLEGDECLVFFLGGLPSHAGTEAVCLGFADNSHDPTERGGKRWGPYYEFRSYRLRDLHGRGFFSYLDPHGRGQPYAYFSSYGEPAGYNRYGGTDCPTLKVWPYAEEQGATPRFLAPDSFQIISAGPDGQFGPGTDSPSHTWAPARANLIPTAGRDDQSNFYNRRLGVRK